MPFALAILLTLTSIKRPDERKEMKEMRQFHKDQRKDLVPLEIATPEVAKKIDHSYSPGKKGATFDKAKFDAAMQHVKAEGKEKEVMEKKLTIEIAKDLGITDRG